MNCNKKNSVNLTYMAVIKGQIKRKETNANRKET